MKLVLPERALPGVELDAGPLVALPLDGRTWTAETLGAGAQVRGVREVATQAGWPLTLVRSDRGDERRVHAFYRFHLHGAVACARGAVDENADGLIALLCGARPDFGGGPIVALAEVWEGMEEASP